MLVLEAPRETLSVAIERDDSTRLPLLSEQGALFDLLLAHLHLPYSVAEFGCGKKTSMILEQLARHDLPLYALGRGMVMERDMSDAALAEQDPGRRAEPLLLDNPLAELADLRDPKLRRKLAASSVRVTTEGDAILAGPYQLRHRPRVQFAVARSHIFTLAHFWDVDRQQAVERVIDPTLCRTRWISTDEVRHFLGAPEALVFTAPLLGRFRLDPDHLTTAQEQRVHELVADGLEGLDEEKHRRLVMRLNGSSEGSIGDPETWSYANNIPSDDPAQDRRQYRLTGLGDELRPALGALLEARTARARDVGDRLRYLGELVDELRLRRELRLDARWAESRLAPLADVANAISYFGSLSTLAEDLEAGIDILESLADPRALDRFWGFGVRLRARLEDMADASEDDSGRIDARALNELFTAATLETIQQMNRAGLSVFVDRVGNIHGASLTAEEVADLRADRLALRTFRGRWICLGSHIDTVEDAGTYDGRLGVLSGIEVAHVATDLADYFERSLGTSGDARKPGEQGSGSGMRLLVTAFIGEEMTFTGNGVSMPGSAAVTGRATVGQVHGMTNGQGERFGDRLLDLLRVLRRYQRAGKIRLMNDLAGVDEIGDGSPLVDACSEPTDFFTPHSYERHIEQGPMLDRQNTPLALVATVMGIHQEDFEIEGPRAEAAALEMVVRCRELISNPDDPEMADLRLTVGVLEALDEGTAIEGPVLAMRWVIHGEKNHAGATALEDRRDPGVAAARLAREHVAWVQEHSQRLGLDLEPVIGAVTLDPGTGRNVIPGTAVVELGVLGPLPEDERSRLLDSPRAFAAETLSRTVVDGGEGIFGFEATPVSFVNTAHHLRLSIDLRAATDRAIRHCREDIRGVIAELESAFDVTIRAKVAQEVPPYPLDRLGQVLQLERSYGGSHNPHEAQLAYDLVRGTVLQLGVVHEIFRDGGLVGETLYQKVRSRLPGSWRERLGGFVSGALHDTCNIAAAVLEESRTPSSAPPGPAGVHPLAGTVAPLVRNSRRQPLPSTSGLPRKAREGASPSPTPEAGSATRI